MSRLIDAFYDARMEESLMFVDKVFKEIKAHNVFAEMPSRSSANKFQVDVSKNSALNMFDKMPESTPTESSAILTMDYPQVLGNDNSNSAMANGNPIEEVQESEDDVNAQGNDDVAMRLEADSGKVVMSNGVAYKMFDNSIDNSTEPKFTGLNSFSGKSYPISMMEEVEFPSLKDGVQLMEKDEELFPTKLEVVKVAYQAFDEMPKLFSVEPNAEIHGDKSSVTLIDCVPRVFDPGSDTTENVCTNGSSLEEIEGLAPRKGRNLMYPALGKSSIAWTFGTYLLLSDEESKVFDHKKTHNVATLLKDFDITVDERLEAPLAFGREEILLYKPSLGYGVEYLEMSLEVLVVAWEEILP